MLLYLRVLLLEVSFDVTIGVKSDQRYDFLNKE